MNDLKGKLIFGTYKLCPSVLDIALRQALEFGIRTVDTALLYDHLELVAGILKDYPDARVQGKVHRKKPSIPM